MTLEYRLQVLKRIRQEMQMNSSAKGDLLNNLSFTTLLNYIFEVRSEVIDNKKEGFGDGI